MSTCHSSTGGGGGANIRSETPKSEERYYRFSDKAAGTHEYAGSGKETVEFFKNNSNYAELIGSMSSSERDDFRAWTSGHFMDGQMYERFSTLSPSDQKKIRTYDKILDQAELKQGITVTRRSTAEFIFGKGKRAATLEELQAAEGKTVLCKGCLSTGAASEGLLINGTKRTKPIEYSIKIPAGKGRGMWVGNGQINSWAAGQREFMTNRDAAYKIGKTTYDSKRGVYKVEITMLDVNTGSRHDYS